MKTFRHPYSIGNMMIFSGFALIAYSSFIFTYQGESPVDQPGAVLATCVSDGAYGETCTTEESYRIEKWVRIKGDDAWVDKVNDVQEEDIVEFKITNTNTGDEDSDNMKMTDTLPSEMERTGGDDLIEEWDDFAADSEETFIIEAKLKASEFDSDTEFEKCVVNKAELEQDDDFVGSDTATVCYNNADVELPETGPMSPLAMGLAGLISTITGAILKKKAR